MLVILRIQHGDTNHLPDALPNPKRNICAVQAASMPGSRYGVGCRRRLSLRWQELRYV